MSTIKTINLQHPSSASNNIVLDSSGNVTGAGTLAMASSFLRNRIINGSFAINQRGYVSGTATASGVYMHDRWKATTANTAYTFTQNKVDTTITITAGTLAQIVEDVNVEGGVYVLSWTGTATARVAINGAATSGAYAASPIITASATAGQTITVEFSTGTLGKVQLEPGTVATPFERRQYGQELALCQRYWRPLTMGNNGFESFKLWDRRFGVGWVDMRTSPSIAYVGSWTGSNVNGFALGAVSASAGTLTIGLGGADNTWNDKWVSFGGYFALNAEL